MELGMWDRLLAAATSAVSAVQGRIRPSTRFLIDEAESAEALRAVLEARGEEVAAEVEILAAVRIAASEFIVREVFLAVRAIAAERAACGAVWMRIAAWRERKKVREAALARVEALLLAFVGLHVSSIAGLRRALKVGRAGGLAHSIVACCRQVSSFMHAVSISSSGAEVLKNVGNAVRSSIGGSLRKDGEVDMHAALAQFWNQNAGAAARPGMGVHDVRLTLQILQRELGEIPGLGRGLWRAVESDLGRPWRVQKHPVWHAKVLGLSAVAASVVCTNARFFGGSGLLEDSIALGTTSAQRFVEQNLIQPVTALYVQIFRNTPTSANEETVLNEQESLREMLVDYSRSCLKHVPDAMKLATDGKMLAVMESYQTQVRNPVRNVLMGDLAQAMLLQVQKLKCDVEELMLKSKQTLRAQELNLALVALMPTMLVAASAVYILSSASGMWRRRGTDFVVSPAQTARFLLSDVQRTLSLLHDSTPPELGDSEALLLDMGHSGMLQFKLFELRELVDRDILHLAPGISSRLLDDVDILRSTNYNVDSKLTVLQQMWTRYGTVL